MKITALLTTIALATLPVISHAATCTRADLTGSWRIYTEFNSVARCTLIMPSTGTTVSTSSYCYLPGVVSSTPLRGTVNIYTDCHVTGSVSIGTEKRTIDAYISKGKDSISGIGWKPSYVYTGAAFSGVKQ